ncbi:iron-sulfur cluster assembly scaffold protein [Pseudoroseicyclus tamaricis]|uniref:Iron-sulfur cluster assembly scaffold protein n=1 Tax=Pseudoroseicyclus tamaricis TaxID=2705421 RepID=A0A6B2JIS5_9RHOB|nr:iron-sulfur cluster assembly scaffold protein [Pseudoroseicyclus tamaricis]NDV01301.1 iron-sulfur cluster assembly scaffold protein [Pseudoroseicyclus tamaricis]
MSADSDLIKLYSARILGLTADMPRIGRLAEPDGEAKRRSPTCGSTVTVTVDWDGERVTDYAQEVKACALGQASASITGRVVVGLDESTIRQGRDELAAMLAGGPPPSAPFDGLEALSPAREYKNRHGSIMLALDATLAAIESAQAARATG